MSECATFVGPPPYDPAALARRRTIMIGVLALSLALMLVKLTAFWITGSRALLSDALESVVNVITGGFGLFSVWLAGRPPDSSHPYGHGKVEFFSAGLEGAMILLAAVGIVRESLPHLLRPTPIRALGTGFALAAVAGAVNGGVGLFLIRRGRRVHSATLSGEGHHLFADTITTAGILLGLLLVHVTGWLVLDPLAACAVAVSIAWTGVTLLRESASRLMDRSDASLLEGIAGVLGSERRPEWIEVHLMRAWKSGDFVHIDFHLTFPRYWPIERVHASQKDLLDVLIRRLGQPGDVMIHPDPCTPRLCGGCRLESCPTRGEPARREQDFSLAKLVGGPAGVDVDTCQTIQAAASRDTSRSD